MYYTEALKCLTASALFMVANTATFSALAQKQEIQNVYPAGKSFKECDNCPVMVVVPSGSFMMGSPDTEKKRTKDEGPRHKVTIAKKFSVGRFEITNKEYVYFLNSIKRRGNKSKPWFKTKTENSFSQIIGDVGNFKVEAGKENFPVVTVSWYGAIAYTDWLSQKTGKNYRLPTEAEWEYVARAGTDTAFWWGNSISTRLANYNGKYTYNNSSKGEYRKKTVKADSFKANTFGLKNVHGNVSEWTKDCYHFSYKSALSDGSARKSNDCYEHVLRGGSFYDGPGGLRSATRLRGSTNIRVNHIGFRVARNLQ